jgi:multidrug transporter EmrE-like cation transporter
MVAKLTSIFFCFLYAAFNVSGAAIIKYQLHGRKLTNAKEWFDFLLHFNVIVAFGIIFLSALIMFKALSTGQFSFIIPVATGVNFMLTVLVGYILFKDSFTFASFIGMSFIITGIIILALYSQKNV